MAKEKREIPKIGSKWKHHNGHTEYEVVLIANEHSTLKNKSKYPVVVVYKGLNGNIWSKTLLNWHRTMTFLRCELDDDFDLSDLSKIQDGLSLLRDHKQNMIVVCPNPEDYAYELSVLQGEVDEIDELVDRISKMTREL